MKRLILYVFTNRNRVLLIFLFVLHVFFRFYDLEHKSIVGWDQIDFAWMAKNIIVDHKFPLYGVQAKLNSGIHMGPLYYYYVVPFYLFTNLDLIASPIIAGVTSIFTFFVLFYVIRKVFSYEVALFSLFFHTISIYVISLDRVQWSVNFIVPLSAIIFYSLYKVIIDQEDNFLLLLSVALGFAFHTHLTAIFFVFIVVLCAPFILKRKSSVKKIILSFIIFTLFLSPNIIGELTTKSASTNTFLNYSSSYSHGFHMTRFFQITKDAFIEFEAVIFDKIPLPSIVKYGKYFLLPILVFLTLYKKINRKSLKLTYLILLWVLVPWIVFTTYSGEISNYYFSSTRIIVLFALGSLCYYLTKYKLSLRILFFFLLIYSYFNISSFLTTQHQGIAYYRSLVEKDIKENRNMEFKDKDPEYYIYYIYTRK